MMNSVTGSTYNAFDVMCYKEEIADLKEKLTPQVTNPFNEEDNDIGTVEIA